MPSNDFAPYIKVNTSFVVQNVSPQIKTIKIFNYPINYNDTRDLLQISGVAESDIRSSLLKGELRHKILAGDIVVIESDIDLLQFNLDHRDFLQSSGINNGLWVTTSQSLVKRLEDVTLLGIINGVNAIFTIPSGTFIQNSDYKIIVYLNGVKQSYLDDYYIAESGGPGTGYNTVIFNDAPESLPTPPDLITADYYIYNN